MQAQIEWQGDDLFQANTPTGQKVTMDCSGTGEQGASPMELVLHAAAGCSAVDIVHILKKSRQEVERCLVDVTGERRDVHPRGYQTMHLHYQVAGPGLTEKQVARAIALSLEKYCSVAAMLQGATKITHSFEIAAQPVASA